MQRGGSAGVAEAREEAGQLRRLELGAMSFVDCVIVHSAAEAELLQQIAPDVEVQVIPWTIAVRDITQITGQQPDLYVKLVLLYSLPPLAAAGLVLVTLRYG